MLVELEQAGLVERTKTDRYQRKQSHKSSNSKLIKGTLSQNKKGFAFLRPEQEDMDDIFIPPTKINRALDGDTVIVEIQKSKESIKVKLKAKLNQSRNILSLK